MAFQQNKTALASAELNQKVRILALALADWLDLMLTPNQVSSTGSANSISAGPTSLISLSYLGTAGAVILSTIPWLPLMPKFSSQFRTARPIPAALQT
jgi:hypothetical protein